MTSSDTSGSLQQLLQQRARVRQLALGLVDSHRADDVVQDTMVMALTRRPSVLHDAYAWASRVVRNFAAQDARAASRRRRHEAQAAARRQEEVEAVVEHADLHRALVAHVLAMPEPLRDVLLLRYFEGLRPQEIARRSGAATSTISNRLSKAHRELRERLTRENDDWSQAVAPLTKLPLVASALWFGGKAAAAVAVAVVAVLCYLLIHPGAVVPPGLPSSPVPPVVASVEESDVRPLERMERERQASPARVAPAPANVLATIRDHHGRPIEGVQARAQFGDEEWQASTDGDGRLSLKGLPTDVELSVSLVIKETEWDKVALRLAPAESRAVEWTLALAAKVHGVAVDEVGQPVAGIVIKLARPRYEARAFARSVRRKYEIAEAVTDVHGSFSFDEVAPGTYIVGPTGFAPRIGHVMVITDETIYGRVAGMLEPLEVPINEADVPFDIRTHAKETISGVVVYPDGSPADNVRLMAVLSGVGGHVGADTDHRGRFRFPPLVPGTYRVTDNGGPDGFGLHGWHTIASGRDDVRLVLQACGGLAGVASLADGRIVSGWIYLTPSLHNATRFLGVSVSTGARSGGRYSVESLPPGEYNVTFYSDDHKWYGFVPGLQVTPGTMFSDANIPLQAAGALTLTTSGEQDVRVEVMVGGKRYRKHRVKPGHDFTFAVPPGAFVVRTRTMTKDVEIEKGETLLVDVAGS